MTAGIVSPGVDIIMAMTLAESMALAVLKGDRLAAYALADFLIEEREQGAEGLAKIAKEIQSSPGAHDGYAVYRWPEFQAFCKRAGILWDLHTIAIEFRIAEGERLAVRHEYAARNNPPPSNSIDTTTLHNRAYRTSAPRSLPYEETETETDG